jgi:hypothetical protein
LTGIYAPRRVTDFRADFNLTDIVGNKDKVTVKANEQKEASDIIANREENFVLVYVDETGEERTAPFFKVPAEPAEITEVDLWDVDVNYRESEPSNPSPYKINARSMKVVTHRTYFNLDLDSHQGAELASIELGDCTGDDFDSWVDSVELFSFNPRDSRAQFVLVTLEKGEIDKPIIEFECQTKTTSLWNEKITPPEFDNVTFIIELYEEGDIADEVKTEIENVMDSWLVQAEWIQWLEYVLHFFEGFCRLLQLFTMIVGIFGAFESLIGWIQYTPAFKAATSFKGASDVTYTTGQNLYRYAHVFCEYISCRIPILADYNPVSLVNTEFRGLTEADPKGTWGKFALFVNKQEMRRGRDGVMPDYSKADTAIDLFPPSPKDSLVLSIFSFCLPGIVTNLHKARQIECTYALCLQQNAPRGAPIRYCVQARAFQWCQYIIGGLFNLFQPIRMLQTFLASIVDMFRDPFSAVLGVVGYICPSVIDVTTSGTCKVIYTTSATINIAKELISWSDTDAWKSQLISADVCGQVKLEEEVVEEVPVEEEGGEE